MYILLNQILVREVGASMYDAISRDGCVSTSLLVCRRETEKHVGEIWFHLSPRVHASTHEPGSTRDSLQPPYNLQMNLSTVM